MKQKELVDKYDIPNLIKNSDLNTKLVTLATKPELKAEKDKNSKLQVIDSSYFHGKNFLVMMLSVGNQKVHLNQISSNTRCFFA